MEMTIISSALVRISALFITNSFSIAKRCMSLSQFMMHLDSFGDGERMEWDGCILWHLYLYTIFNYVFNFPEKCQLWNDTTRAFNGIDTSYSACCLTCTFSCLSYLMSFNDNGRAEWRTLKKTHKQLTYSCRPTGFTRHHSWEYSCCYTDIFTHFAALKRDISVDMCLTVPTFEWVYRDICQAHASNLNIFLRIMSSICTSLFSVVSMDINETTKPQMTMTMGWNIMDNNLLDHLLKQITTQVHTQKETEREMHARRMWFLDRVTFCEWLSFTFMCSSSLCQHILWSFSCLSQPCQNRRICYFTFEPVTNCMPII